MRIRWPVVLLGCACLGAVAVLRAVASPRVAPTSVHHAPWLEKAVIYELNTRQFTPEGTFRAILPRVPELKALGVGVVWFMPIHPIGERGRKGPLGSPYAVRDYLAVNPEFGTLEDFRALVIALHHAGIHVIIDLVANHTARDNDLVRLHPDWFVHDTSGNPRPPVPEWTDVLQLDYTRREVRAYMLGVMEYWVRDVGIDGFRCDVAGMVPTDFWNDARRRLDRVRAVFMLAEAEKPALLAHAFDCVYSCEIYESYNAISHGKATVAAEARPKSRAGKTLEGAGSVVFPAALLDRQLRREARVYPPGSWRLRFTDNHDQNSWHGADVTRLGPAGSRACAVLSFTLPGKPLIYNGQEIGNPRRLSFFDRDPIRWHDAGGFRVFYQRLCDLYRTVPSLYRGGFTRLPGVKDPAVFAFLRRARSDDPGEEPVPDPVLVVVNLSNRPARVASTLPHGASRRVELLGSAATSEHDAATSRLSMTLEPWGFRVWALK